MTTPAAWGTPFGVSTTRGTQYFMKTAAFADGSFVAVWVDESGEDADESGSNIRGQIFNSDGSKRGGEFVVNSTTTSSQGDPVVTVLSDGRFVVAWTDESDTDDKSDTGVRARIFNADGTAFNRGGETGDKDFQVNTTSKANSQGTPSIAALADGGFVIAFGDDSDGNADIKAQVFDARGFHSGAEVLINSGTEGTQSAPTVVASGNGYTVFYQSNVETDMSVHGRTFYTDGRAPSAEFLVSNAEVQSGLAKTTKLSDGRLLVTWVTIEGTAPALRYSGKAQIYNADGSKVGGELSINGSDASIQIVSDVTALPNGGFATVFVSSSEAVVSDIDKMDVGVAVFDANGNRIGSHTKIAGEIELDLFMTLDISTLADGRVVVTSGSIKSPSDYDVHGQIVDVRIDGISIPGTAGNDEYYGTTLNDSLTGAAGNDKLVGEAGDDILNGGAGSDTMIGGLGIDTYHVDDAADQITELAGGGTDTVISSISYTLGAELENLLGSGTLALTLTGNAVANVITGADGKDRLTGDLGDDTLGGGYGNDVLVGGKGKDVFVFAAKLGTYKTDRKVNFDTISDFKLKEDKIHLDNAIFTKLKKTGKLSKSFFSIDKANDKNDYIVYNKSKGVLSYDVDGSGGKKAIEFAKVKAKLNLKYSDFFVI